MVNYYCQCGCDILLTKRKDGRKSKYIRGHWNKLKDKNIKGRLDEIKYCKCDCGQILKWKNSYRCEGWPKFIHGHQNKVRKVDKTSIEYIKFNRKIRNELARQGRLEKPYYRIIATLRARLGKAVERKSNSTKNLLGCTIKELREHLEEQFKDGMTWNNYGVKGWHIDHIKPCIQFDLIKEEEQEKCFHYTNLQPLWAKDNLRKGGKSQNLYTK